MAHAAEKNCSLSGGINWNENGNETATPRTGLQGVTSVPGRRTACAIRTAARGNAMGKSGT